MVVGVWRHIPRRWLVGVAGSVDLAVDPISSLSERWEGSRSQE